MAFGPGLLGGEQQSHRGATNLVIAGHRDTHFAPLAEILAGDLLQLQLAGERVRSYRVVRQAVVDRTSTWPLFEPIDGPQLLTLITCYPFDALVPGGPLRYVVQAELTEVQQEPEVAD